MNRRYNLLTTLMLAIILVVGCGTAGTTTLPTDTPAPPSTTPAADTPAPPTTAPPADTPVPPTTTVPPTNAPEPTLPVEDCVSAGLPELACKGVSANDDWTPVIREFNGVSMVLVPAGCFNMGDEAGLAEERPVHRICFERPFWIDLTETTVAQFAQFLNGQDEPVDSYDGWLDVAILPNGEVPLQITLEHGLWEPLPGRDNQPAENVTWMGANDYCAWRQARLPTEAEWEYAARGPDSLLYPWGNEYVSDNLLRSGTQMPDVGSIPQGASWVGALDMSGSLYEWTSSLYRPYPYDPHDGREASLEQDFGHRVFRGCPWYHSEDNVHGSLRDNVSATARHDNPPDIGLWYFGFRCARPFNPSSDWPTAAPEEQGMDAGLLAEMVDEIQKNDYDIDSVTVIRHGSIVLDAYFPPFGPDSKHIIHSCTKSIVSALIGIAIDQGYIEGVDQPVLDLFPGRTAANLDADKEGIRLEDLLTMSSGLECRDSYLYNWQGLSEMRRSDDWVQFMLDLPMAEAPGTRFEYCNGGSFLLSAILQEATGMSTLAFAEKNLFGPLGITDVDWPANAQGITIGWGEMYLKPHDMAKIGSLYLNGGWWESRQIVPADWVEVSTRAHIAAGTLSDRYGYQWWVDDSGYYMAIGYKGQFIYVVPEKNLVVVFTSDLADQDFIIPERLLNEYILPAAD